MIQMFRYLGILLLALLFIQIYGVLYGALLGKHTVKEAAAHNVRGGYTYLVFD